MTSVIVEELRGGLVETRHVVHAAVVDATGRLLAHAGDPELVTFWRSGAKPFQALPLVQDGVVERFGITAPELALCCASHSSEPPQVRLGREPPRGGRGARPAEKGGWGGGRSVGGAPPAALGASRAGLRDPRRAAHRRLFELLGEARRHAGAGAPPRLAGRVLHPSRSPRAAV